MKPKECADPTIWSYGLSRMVNPSEYSEISIEMDRRDLERRRKQLRERKEKLKSNKDQIKMDGNSDAPDDTDVVAHEVEALDNQLSHCQAAYEECTTELVSLRIIDVLRSELDAAEKNYEKALDGLDESVVCDVARVTIQELGCDVETINFILGEMGFSARISKIATLELDEVWGEKLDRL